MTRKSPAIERFSQKVAVDPDTLCWVWTGSTTRDGYALLNGDGRTVRAHRWIYERYEGAIPADRELDHVCRNRACVNPDHLEAVTHLDNVRRGWASSDHQPITQCIHGHPFDAENTTHAVRADGRLRRQCRACDAAKQARYRQRRRMGVALKDALAEKRAEIDAQRRGGGR